MTFLERSLTRVDVVVDDITRTGAHAIVNAANESLLGGGGVDGAIHRAAGPRLLEHNRTLGGCMTGLAVLTPSFDLETLGTEHIIHTVGPIWRDEPGKDCQKLGYTGEDVLLGSCYQRSLELARDAGVETVAFPAISTGAFGFPIDRAAKIAIGHVLAFLEQHEKPMRVTFCCFDAADAEVYRAVIDTRDNWLFQRKRV